MADGSDRTAANATPVFLAPYPGATSGNLTTETGTLLKTGPGVFLGITSNVAQADGTLEVIDGVNGAGRVIGTYSLASVGAVNVPGGGLPFTTGLFVITMGTGTANSTVFYA